MKLHHLKTISQVALISSAMASASIISGCALAPQVISLTEQQSSHFSAITSSRTALIRVNDTRADKHLGYRGGWDSKQSPLIAEPGLEQQLTKRLQTTFAELGFGGSSEQVPVKFELLVKTFDYQCNEGIWVSNCQLKMDFVAKLGSGYSKAFGLNQHRSVVSSPRAEYNQEWINQALDEVWQHIFSNQALLDALAK